MAERADTTIVSRPARVRSRGSGEGGPMDRADGAVISRRTAIGGALGGALVTLLARPELAMAEEGDRQPPTLVLLLRGLYQPVVSGPDLGLS